VPYESPLIAAYGRGAEGSAGPAMTPNVKPMSAHHARCLATAYELQWPLGGYPRPGGVRPGLRGAIHGAGTGGTRRRKDPTGQSVGRSVGLGVHNASRSGSKRRGETQGGRFEQKLELASARRLTDHEPLPAFRRMAAAPVKEQMGLKRGHRIPAHPARLADLVRYLVLVKDPQSLPRVLMLPEQPISFLAVHATIRRSCRSRHQ